MKNSPKRKLNRNVILWWCFVLSYSNIYRFEITKIQDLLLFLYTGCSSISNDHSAYCLIEAYINE